MSDKIFAHNSPLGINENTDKGFERILNYVKKYKPKYVLHGH